MSEIEELKVYIGRLETHNIQLRHALQTIDKEIDYAAAKYLSTKVPTGKLPFRSFIELLELEMRRKYGIERDGAKWVIGTEIRAMLKSMVQNKINELTEALLPQIQASLPEIIRIPILVEPARLGKPNAVDYRALSIRGSIRPGYGSSRESAYGDLRERLVYLLSKSPRELFKKNMGAMVRFDKSVPFFSENIGGWTVEARSRQ